MKKTLYIVVVMSLASVSSLSGIALAAEKGNLGVDRSTWVQVAQQKNWNSSKNNTSTAIKKGGNDDGKGNNLQGVTVPVPFQDAIDATKKGVSTDSDEDDSVHGSGDPLKGLNVARAKKK